MNVFFPIQTFTTTFVVANIHKVCLQVQYMLHSEFLISFEAWAKLAQQD